MIPPILGLFIILGTMCGFISGHFGLFRPFRGHLGSLFTFSWSFTSVVDYLKSFWDDSLASLDLLLQLLAIFKHLEPLCGQKNGQWSKIVGNVAK